MIKKVFFYLFIIITIQAIIYAILCQAIGPLKFHSLLLFCSLFITLIGAAILFIRYERDQFVGRFMTATTFQILAFLAIVSALVYKKIPDFFHHAMAMLTYFAGMLILQSIFLIRFVRAEERDGKKSNRA